MLENLKRIADKILFEDNWNKYGSEYMSHPVADEEDDELPVDTTELMPNRLAIESPPVEDNEYLPSNSSELSSALAAIAQHVPHKDVIGFYRLVRDSFESNAEGELNFVNNQNEDDQPSEEEAEADEAKLQSDLIGSSGDMMKYESKIRRAIKEILLSESYWGDIKFGRQDEFEEDEFEEDELEPAATTNKEEIKGKYAAKYYGKAGPSGVTLGTQRLMQNFLKHMYDVKEEDIKDASDYIAFHIKEQIPSFDDQEVFQTVRSKIFKKGIKKLVKSESNITQDFLETIVRDVMKLRRKEILKMVDEAEKESQSEQAAFSELVDFLEKEDPEQYEVLKNIFGNRVG